MRARATEAILDALSNARAEYDAAMAELQNITSQLETAEHELTECEANLDATNRQISETEGAIAAKQEELAAEQQQLMDGLSGTQAYLREYADGLSADVTALMEQARTEEEAARQAAYEAYLAQQSAGWQTVANDGGFGRYGRFWRKHVGRWGLRRRILLCTGGLQHSAHHLRPNRSNRRFGSADLQPFRPAAGRPAVPSLRIRGHLLRRRYDDPRALYGTDRLLRLGLRVQLRRVPGITSSFGTEATRGRVARRSDDDRLWAYLFGSLVGETLAVFHAPPCRGRSLRRLFPRSRKGAVRGLAYP